MSYNSSPYSLSSSPENLSLSSSSSTSFPWLMQANRSLLKLQQEELPILDQNLMLVMETEKNYQIALFHYYLNILAVNQQLALQDEMKQPPHQRITNTTNIYSLNVHPPKIKSTRPLPKIVDSTPARKQTKLKILAFYRYTIDNRHYIKVVRAQPRLIKRLDKIILHKQYKKQLPLYLASASLVKHSAQKIFAFECDNPKRIWNIFFYNFKQKEFFSMNTIKSSNTTLVFLTPEEIVAKYNYEVRMYGGTISTLDDFLANAILTPEKFHYLISSYFTKQKININFYDE